MSGLHIPPFAGRGPSRGGGGNRRGRSPSDASAGGSVTGRGIAEPPSRGGGHWGGRGVGGGGGGGARTAAINIGGRSRARGSAGELRRVFYAVGTAAARPRLDNRDAHGLCFERWP